MNIGNLKSILSATTTYTSSTLNHFESGKVYEYPNNGLPENYPLLFLEEDYLFETQTIGNTKMDSWTFSFIVVNTINEQSTKDEKDIMRDAMLVEAEKVVSYLNFEFKRLFEGSITSANYLSLLDYEQDNSQGWRVDINALVATSEVRCNPYE